MCTSSIITKYSCSISSWFSVLDSSEWPRQSIFFCVQVKMQNSLCFFLLLITPFPQC